MRKIICECLSSRVFSFVIITTIEKYVYRSPANKPKIYLGPGSSPVPSADECQETNKSEPESAEAIKLNKPDVPDLISFEHFSELECDNQMGKTLDNFDLVMPASSGSDLNFMDQQEPKQQRSDSVEVMVSTPPPDLIAEGVENALATLPTSDSDVTLATTLTQEETEEVANAEKLGRSATVREGSRNTQSRRERMLKRLSYPVESLSSYTQSSISKILSSSPRNLVDFSSGLFVRSGGATDEEKEESGTETRADDKDGGTLASDAQQQIINVGYKNMVEEKPDFFAEVDSKFPFFLVTSCVCRVGTLMTYFQAYIFPSISRLIFITKKNCALIHLTH